MKIPGYLFQGHRCSKRCRFFVVSPKSQPLSNQKLFRKKLASLVRFYASHRVDNESIERLGLDLAVAHMVCGIGGRVQFIGHDKWIHKYAGLPPPLPNEFCDLMIESIDLSGTSVVYEGFELLAQLTNLKTLRLRRCLHVDDFCLSRVARIKTLNTLDVSECPRLTSKGVATLAHAKQLQTLFIDSNPQMEDKELVCLMLEDHLPKLYIDGVDYIGQLEEASKQKILLLVAGNDETEQQQITGQEQDEELDKMVDGATG